MLIAAEGSFAMSLGRHSGAVLIGRPLDIVVPVVLDGREDLSALCIEASVFYADNKLNQSRVQLTAEKASQAGRNAFIRIRSTVPVDEPVVSVQLSAGCQQKTEKRYVILADVVSEVSNMPAQAAPDAATTGRLALRPQANLAGFNGFAAAESRSARSSQRSGASRRGVNGSARASAEDTAPAAQGGKQRAKDAKVAQKGAARLKLEALDLSPQRDPQLRASADLLSVPTSSPQERYAAAALWRALSAQPQDLMRDAERLQTLETSVLEWQTQSQKNKRSIEDLNGRVKQAQAERYANPLVYALGIFLLLALIALALVTRRRFNSKNSNAGDLPWWRKNEPQGKGWANSAHEAGASPLSAGITPVMAANSAKVAGKAKRDLDFDLSSNELGLSEVKHLSGLGSADSLLAMSRADRGDVAGRALKVEELFDVQQQADFFISLGQHEQAIEVLRSHIGDNAQTSALVYLDLFNIYHQLRHQSDYEALREEFNQRFNAKIPLFEHYSDISSGLEAYESALPRIEALWPSPKVLDVIEEALFRRPDGGSETFNLEAYRELLMLYSVAREIISPEGGASIAKPTFDLPDVPDSDDMRTSKFIPTSIQPLSASVVDELPAVPGVEPLLASVLPPSSPRLGLDLDLSDFGSVGESPAPEVESDSHFFAQFTTELPLVSPPSANPKSPGTAAELDNLIDFDSFGSSVPNDYKTKPPKK